MVAVGHTYLGLLFGSTKPLTHLIPIKEKFEKKLNQKGPDSRSAGTKLVPSKAEDMY